MRTGARWRTLTHFAAVLLLAALSCGGLPARADSWPTSGGEPGRIIEVTNLSDSGPGSLREALESNGRRKIVFTVAGEIWLQSRLLIRNPFITVAGETAPSPGISLMGDMVRIRSHDVVFRHIRVRVGALPGGTDPNNRDGIEIDGSEDGSDPGYNVLVENCSISWGIDENVQIWGPNSHDIVVRKSIIAEGLNHSIHPKGAHSMGLMVGPRVRNVVIQANLFAHNGGRNPVVHGGAEALVVNNLVYNPGYAAVHFYPRQGDGPSKAAVVGNYVALGPSSDTKPRMPAFSLGLNSGSEVYYSDNVSTGTVAFDPQEQPAGWTTLPFVTTPPIWPNVVDVLPSQDVPAYVLANAGARPWDRDAVDARIVSEVQTNGGQIRDVPTDSRLYVAQ